MSDIVFSPSDFVAVVNQTFDYAYPVVTIVGELSSFRVSKNRWVYFDLKDDNASVKFFGTVFNLLGPLEDGMVVSVTGHPKLSAQYGFSVNVTSITPVGEGSLKRAADLLFAKLEKEGLFDPARKRIVPFAPQTIGLITSKESAAFADFNKILNERWGGVEILHYDIQVQGEQAVSNIVEALQVMNQLPTPPEVLVITRGGGGADDLAAFSTEQVVRAVAASRIPTLVAIGHEVDTSLAELAADLRASTPSNAAQLLTPDKKDVIEQIRVQNKSLQDSLQAILHNMKQYTSHAKELLSHKIDTIFTLASHNLKQQEDLLEALNPEAALKRGYAVLRSKGKVLKSVKAITVGQKVSFQLYDGLAEATVDAVDL